VRTIERARKKKMHSLWGGGTNLKKRAKRSLAQEKRKSLRGVLRMTKEARDSQKGTRIKTRASREGGRHPFEKGKKGPRFARRSGERKKNSGEKEQAPVVRTIKEKKKTSNQKKPAALGKKRQKGKNRIKE